MTPIREQITWLAFLGVIAGILAEKWRLHPFDYGFKPKPNLWLEENKECESDERDAE